MDDVSPAVTSLWRLIQLLDEDENAWTRKQDAMQAATPVSEGVRDWNQAKADVADGKVLDNKISSDRSKTNDDIVNNNNNNNNKRSTDDNDNDSCSNDDDDEDEEDKPVKETASTRRSRRDDVMISKHKPRRGRTPSPKRSPAPAPPNPRDCPSPVPKLVSTSDITPADHQGWLIDQLRGRKVWCAVSDMLFCVFEKEGSHVSKQVIFLPSCKVRHIEFKSASQEGKILNGVARHFASKTITGVDKFQFLIENGMSRQKYMFGVPSRTELDQWIEILARACSLDVSSEPPEGDRSENGSGEQVVTPRSKSGPISPRSPNSDLMGSAPAYTPSQTLPRRIDVHSLSMSLTQPHDVSKDTVDDIRKRLRKEHHEPDTKPSPLKAKHDDDRQEKTTPSSKDDNRKSRSFFKIKSPLDILLRRKKRSASADDAQGRRKLFPVMDADNLSNPSFSPRLSDSQSSLAPSLESNQSFQSHDTSFTGSADSHGSAPDKKRNLLSRSLDFQKNSKGFGSNIRRTASDLKDKMFGFSSSSKDAKFRSAGVKLKDLQDAPVSGYLQYRIAYKFSKVFCVLCRGCFYAFKTEKPDESPILAVVLNQCSVTYIAEPEDRQKRLFAFKLCQPHSKSIYICVEDHQSLVKWMMALQTEACKIQVDEELATEIREKRSSQKKRQAREMKMSQRAIDLEARRREMQIKRNSCPNLSDQTSSNAQTKGNNQENADRNAKIVRRTESSREVNIPIDIYDNKYSSQPSNGHSATESEAQAVSIPSKTSNASQDSNCRKDFHHDAPQVSEKPNKPEETGLSTGNAFIPAHRRSKTEHDLNYSSQQQQQHQQQIPVRKRTATVKRTASLDKRILELSSRAELQRPKSALTNPVPQNRDTDGKITSFFSPAPVNQSQSSKEIHSTDQEPIIDYDTIDGSLNYTSSQSNGTNVQRPYDVASTIHDEALKSAWSTEEEFLLNVAMDKLRKRRQREHDESSRGFTDEGVVVVNDQWNVSDTAQIPQPSKLLREEMDVDVSNQDSDEATGEIPNTDRPSQDNDRKATETSEHALMEGFLDKRGFNGQWQRYWCVLREGCLYCYLKSNDSVSSDITDLKGYEATQLIDKFQGKRFVLSLKHKNYISVLLSLDTRDELMDWHEAINQTLKSLDIATEDENVSNREEMPQGMKQEEASLEKSEPGSAQTVKQKLLAEMLRQKLELEKMQAARNGMKGDVLRDGKQATPSPTPGSPRTNDDDRICALTRLRQRRMSTQIKLNVIQKQMEASSNSPKEKKTVFQLSKKKPDAAQGHSDSQNHVPELEEQVKVLSSRLQELDTCITSHGAVSPRDQSPARITSRNKNLRHSYDPSLLKDVHVAESAKDVHEDNDVDNLTKTREKDKDVSKSTSLKSSVQKLAHRTFAKANWHWTRKSPSGADDKDGIKSPTIQGRSLSDLTPDVIDVTNNNNTANNKFYTVDGREYPAPPDNFRTEYTLLTGTLPGRRKAGTHRTPKERILSKLSSSSSLTNLDVFNSRMKSSLSSPSLVKLGAKTTDEVDNSGTNSTDNGMLCVPKLSNGSFEEDSTLSPPDSARSYGSSVTSPRREVNPHALAEIEAFEELSLKFLGSSMGSK